MDLSIHDVMNDLVRADAAQMSGRDFADARGGGVARRVRTRRTVRAAGIGGGTMLTAGALVMGALNLPWETKTAPGPGGGVGGDCATPWPEPYPYVVSKRYADYLPETWMIIHPASEEIVFTITPEDVGQTWLVTYPSGATEVVPYSGASEVRVDVPDGPSILLSVWMIDGGTEMAVTAYSVTPGGPLIAPIDDCYSQGATPTPSSSTVRPNVDPSLAASTEQVTSPFECGFVFETDASDAPHLAVTATAWTTPAGSASWGDNSLDFVWTDGLVDTSANAAHGVAKQSLGNPSAESVVSGMDPGDPAVRAEWGGPSDGTYTGVGFVSVRDDVVVGILRLDFNAGVAPFAVTGMGDQFAASLSDPESAFVACPGEEPGDVSVDVYFVVSAVTMKGGDPNPVAGPEYAWSHIAAFRGDVPSNYYPNN